MYSSPINPVLEQRSWPVQLVQSASQGLYSLGNRTAHLIGLNDLRMGMEEAYLGEYGTGLKYLAKGTLKLGLTVGALYTTYKVANYAIDYMERQPVDYTPDVGKCEESSILKQKWNGITCQEVENDPELQRLIERPEIYKGKKFIGEKLDIKRNRYGELLFPVKGGYEKWSVLREIEKSVGLSISDEGFVRNMSPFSVKPNTTNLEPSYYLDINTWDEYLGPSSYPHNSIRLREVTTSEVKTYSFGFYPEGRGFWPIIKSIFWPTQGVVILDPKEFDIKDTTNITQTTIKVAQEEFDKMMKIATTYSGNYSARNFFNASSCKGFVEDILNSIGKNPSPLLWYNPLSWLSIVLPTSLGDALAETFASTTIKDAALISLKK